MFLFNSLTAYIKRELYFKLNPWTIVSLIICFLIFSPIFIIIINFNIQTENWAHIKEYLLLKYIFSSSLLVIGVGLISTIIGVGCAWIVTCYNFHGKRLIEWTLLLPMTVPTYIVAYSYSDILELFNPLFIWSRKNIGIKYTLIFDEFLVFFIVIILFSFVLYPYVYISTRASLMLQGNRLVEAANMLGYKSSSIFFKVILPMIKPAIAAGLSLVVMETLNDYAAVEYFGISTLTIGIFRSWFGMNDISSALKISAFLVLFILLILVLERLARGQEKYFNRTGAPNELIKINLSLKDTIKALLFCIIPVVFGFIFPVTRQLIWLFYSDFSAIDKNIFNITINTISISFFSCIMIVIISFTINFVKSYFGNDILKKFGQLAILGYSMPGAIIGIGILKLNGYISQSYTIIITGTVFGLVFAYIIRFLAVAWQPIESSMEKQCASINQTSRFLSKSTQQAMFKVNIPILKKTLLLTCLIVFVDIMKELPLTLILRPFNFDTLSTLTYDLINQAQFFQSSLSSLLIIFISLPIILFVSSQIKEEN